jgi:hypothetical protein
MRYIPRILAGLVVATSLSWLSGGGMSDAASSNHTVVASDSARSGFLLQTVDGNIFLPLDAVAGVEGVSSATLQQDLQAGQTLLQVAGPKYSSAADLATALLANLKHKLDMAMAASSGKFPAAEAAAQYAAFLSATETLVTTQNPKIVTEQGKSGAGKQPGAQVNLKLDLINAVAASCNTTTGALQTLLNAGSTTILAACQTTNPSATVASLSAAILSAIRAQIAAQEASGQITAAEGTQLLAKLQAGLPSLLTTVPQQRGDSSAKKG